MGRKSDSNYDSRYPVFVLVGFPLVSCQQTSNMLFVELRVSTARHMGMCLQYPRKNQFKRSSDHCSCDRMLRCGVRGVCPTEDFLTFCQKEEQFFASDVFFFAHLFICSCCL